MCFMFINFVVLLLLLRNAFRFGGREANKYTVFLEANEHFVNSLRPFSYITYANKDLVRDRYMNYSGLDIDYSKALHFLVRDYLHFHTQSRNNATRILVFRPGTSDLSESLVYLAFAFWAASVSRRLLLVDWREPFPLDKFLVNAKSEVNLFFHAPLDDPRNETTSGVTSKTIAFLNGSDISLFSYEPVLSSSLEVVVMQTNDTPSRFSEYFVSKYAPKDVQTSYVDNLRDNAVFYRVLFHHAFRLSDEARIHQRLMHERMRLRPVYSRRPSLTWPGFPKKQSIVSFKSYDEWNRPYIGVHADVGLRHKQVSFVNSKEAKLRMKRTATCLASRAVRLSFMSGIPALPVYLSTDSGMFRKLFSKNVKRFSKGGMSVIKSKKKVNHAITRKFLKAIGGETRNHDLAHNQNTWASLIDFVNLGHAEHIIALEGSVARLAMGLGTAETLVELRDEVCQRVEYAL